MAVRSVRDLLSARWGVPLTPRHSSPIVTVGVTVVSLLRQDAARVGFMVANLGAFTLFLIPQGAGFPPDATHGIRLEPNGGALTVNWEEDGEAVAYEWLAAASGNSTSVYFLETLIDQGRETS